MIIKVKLNKDNYIEGYASIGDVDNSVEVILQNELVNRTEEYSTKWNPITNKFDLADIVSFTEEVSEEFANNYIYYKLVDGVFIFDEDKKITEALESSIEKLEKEIIEKTTELEKIKNSMFAGTQKELDAQKELDTLNQQYLDLNHELALQIENRLREV